MANALLHNLTDKLHKRNKLIRFADKSPAGWNAMDEYESDELADNSEDEKKLRSAERLALSRMKFKGGQSKTAKPTVTSTRSAPNPTQLSNTDWPTLSQQPFRGYSRSFRQYGQFSPSDKCFSCGADTGLVRPSVSTSTVQTIRQTHRDKQAQILLEKGHKLAAGQ